MCSSPNAEQNKFSNAEQEVAIGGQRPIFFADYLFEHVCGYAQLVHGGNDAVAAVARRRARICARLYPRRRRVQSLGLRIHLVQQYAQPAQGVGNAAAGRARAERDRLISLSQRGGIIARGGDEWLVLLVRLGQRLSVDIVSGGF